MRFRSYQPPSATFSVWHVAQSRNPHLVPDVKSSLLASTCRLSSTCSPATLGRKDLTFVANVFYDSGTRRTCVELENVKTSLLFQTSSMILKPAHRRKN